MTVRHFLMAQAGFPDVAPTRWLVVGQDVGQLVADLNSPFASRFTIGPSETIEQAFKRTFSWIESDALHETELPPGGYFPRIIRPLDTSPGESPGRFPTNNLYASEIAGASGQLASLVGRLHSICQVVEPTAANLDAYGHEIRECLMIAAMEVESHCKAVLRANGVSLTNSNTEDYVKLLTAMKLDDYEIALSRYPDLDLIRPFAGWDPARPTQSLAFYAAYNSVKHDRETAFDRGTLKLALEAVAACAVLATAQFGWASIFGSNRGLEEFFTLTSVPRWRLSETYMMETHGWLAREVHYKF